MIQYTCTPLVSNALINYDPTKPLKLRVEITLTEDQMYVISQQAKSEYRSVDQMIQLLLFEGWCSYACDHSLYVKRKDPDSAHAQFYNDQETIDLMTPIIPERL